MPTFINGIRDGVLAPSRMFATEDAAQRALEHLLAVARASGHRVRSDEVAGFYVWTVRDIDGVILQSWWLSEEEHGPAMRAIDQPRPSVR